MTRLESARGRASRRVATTVALLVATMMVACASKPKAGEACTVEAAQACMDTRTAVICADGIWSRLPCRGQAGCETSPSGATCANDGYVDEDPCGVPLEYGCNREKNALVRCIANRWRTTEKCLGPGGCATSAEGVTCDDSVAEVGAPCQTEDTYACGVEGPSAATGRAIPASMLKCTKGTFVYYERCRGPHGCSKDREKVECNQSIAAEDDYCDEAGEKACSVDGAALLSCIANKFTTMRPCEKCTPLVHGIDCR